MKRPRPPRPPSARADRRPRSRRPRPAEARPPRARRRKAGQDVEDSLVAPRAGPRRGGPDRRPARAGRALPAPPRCGSAGVAARTVFEVEAVGQHHDPRLGSRPRSARTSAAGRLVGGDDRGRRAAPPPARAARRRDRAPDAFRPCGLVLLHALGVHDQGRAQGRGRCCRSPRVAEGGQALRVHDVGPSLAHERPRPRALRGGRSRGRRACDRGRGRGEDRAATDRARSPPCPGTRPRRRGGRVTSTVSTPCGLQMPGQVVDRALQAARWVERMGGPREQGHPHASLR